MTAFNELVLTVVGIRLNANDYAAGSPNMMTFFSEVLRDKSYVPWRGPLNDRDHDCMHHCHIDIAIGL